MRSASVKAATESSVISGSSSTLSTVADLCLESDEDAEGFSDSACFSASFRFLLSFLLSFGCAGALFFWGRGSRG